MTFITLMEVYQEPIRGVTGLLITVTASFTLQASSLTLLMTFMKIPLKTVNSLNRIVTL